MLDKNSDRKLLNDVRYMPYERREQIENTPNTTSRRAPCQNPPLTGYHVETDPKKLQHRISQIEKGKNTIGYTNYTKLVPRKSRKREDPRTPDPYREWASKRAFEGAYTKWRKLLHQYDNSSNDKEEDYLEPFIFLEDPEETVNDILKKSPQTTQTNSTITPMNKKNIDKKDIEMNKLKAQKYWDNMCIKAEDSCALYSKKLGINITLVERTALEQRSFLQEVIKRDSQGDHMGIQMVSLEDPNSGSRIQIPIRGRHCRHLCSIDLESFLKNSPVGARYIDSLTNKLCTTYACPICMQPIQSNDIILDCFTVGPLYFQSNTSIEIGYYHYHPNDNFWSIPDLEFDIDCLNGTVMCPF